MKRVIFLGCATLLFLCIWTQSAGAIHGFYDGFCFWGYTIDTYRYWPEWRLDREGGLTYFLDPDLTQCQKDVILDKMQLLMKANSRLRFTESPFYDIADITFTHEESVYQKCRAYFTGPGGNREISLGYWEFENTYCPDIYQTSNWLYYMMGIYIPHAGNPYNVITLASHGWNHDAGINNRNNYCFLGGLHHLYPEYSSGCYNRLAFCLRGNYAQGMILTSRKNDTVCNVGINERDLGLYDSAIPGANYTNQIDGLSFGNDYIDDLANARLFFSYRLQDSLNRDSHNHPEDWRSATIFRRETDTTGRIEINGGYPDSTQYGLPISDELHIVDKLGAAVGQIALNPNARVHYFYYDTADFSMRGGHNPYFSVANGGYLGLPGATVYYNDVDHTFVPYSQLKKYENSQWIPLTTSDDIDALMIKDQDLDGVFESGDVIIYSLKLASLVNGDKLIQCNWGSGGNHSFSIVNLGQFSVADFTYDEGAIDGPFDIDGLDAMPKPTLKLDFNYTLNGYFGERPIEQQSVTLASTYTLVDAVTTPEPQSYWKGPDALRYTNFGKFSINEGSIDMQVQINFEGDDDQDHTFCVIPLGDMSVMYECLYIGKYNDNNFYFQLANGPNPPWGCVVADASAWHVNDTIRIQGRWKYNPVTDMIDIDCSINGNCIGNAVQVQMTPLKSYMVMGYDPYYDYYQTGATPSSPQSKYDYFYLYDELIPTDCD